MFPDSRIAQEFKLSRTSASYMIADVLGPYFKAVLCADIEKQKVLGSKQMKLLEKAIPSKETTKTKAGASQSGVPRKKTKK